MYIYIMFFGRVSSIRSNLINVEIVIDSAAAADVLINQGNFLEIPCTPRIGWRRKRGRRFDSARALFAPTGVRIKLIPLGINFHYYTNECVRARPFDSVTSPSPPTRIPPSSFFSSFYPLVVILHLSSFHKPYLAQANGPKIHIYKHKHTHKHVAYMLYKLVSSSHNCVFRENQTQYNY